MLVIAIGTARSGSKGVPNKNLKKIGGHSLLDWSIKSTLQTKLISSYYLSTDSEEYANLAKAALPRYSPRGLD